MNKFEATTIKKAFDRCYGLQAAIQANFQVSIQELSHQTGLQTQFIITHLDQIKRI